MKRSYLVHFLAIKNNEFLNIKASLAKREVSLDNQGGQAEKKAPSFPIQNFRLLSSNEFQVKIIGRDADQNEIYKKVFESDSFGNLMIRIPLDESRKKIKMLQVFEVVSKNGLEILLGNFIPLQITDPKKIIICDFDKTLVDTRYSTTKEMYKSLTSPLENFPTIPRSVEIVKSYIEQGYHPFILSASPHFYENAMRDWLNQNQIFAAGIFLKDYRNVFSFFSGELTPKDLKIQGTYKLNHIFDILLMTGIPDELVMIGDNFESDPLIYLVMTMMLKDTIAPWNLWNKLKQREAFKLTRKQNSQFLNKIYQLDNLLGHKFPNPSSNNIKVKIYIRKKADENDISVPTEFSHHKSEVELYQGYQNQSQLAAQ